MILKAQTLDSHLVGLSSDEKTVQNSSVNKYI